MPNPWSKEEQERINGIGASAMTVREQEHRESVHDDLDTNTGEAPHGSGMGAEAAKQREDEMLADAHKAIPAESPSTVYSEGIDPAEAQRQFNEKLQNGYFSAIASRELPDTGDVDMDAFSIRAMRVVAAENGMELPPDEELMPPKKEKEPVEPEEGDAISQEEAEQSVEVAKTSVDVIRDSAEQIMNIVKELGDSVEELSDAPTEENLEMAEEMDAGMLPGEDTEAEEQRPAVAASKKDEPIADSSTPKAEGDDEEPLKDGTKGRADVDGKLVEKKLTDKAAKVKAADESKGVILFADGSRGIYIPQFFAESIKRDLVKGVSDEDWEILEAGPDHEFYLETWGNVESNAEVILDGHKYTLANGEGGGDLFLICPELMTAEEKENFGMEPDEEEPEADEPEMAPKAVKAIRAYANLHRRIDDADFGKVCAGLGVKVDAAKKVMAGKTVEQIQKKADDLKKRLDGKPVHENFGEKEGLALDDFIGDTYSYSYDDRMKINEIKRKFFDWTTNYTGHQSKAAKVEANIPQGDFFESSFVDGKTPEQMKATIAEWKKQRDAAEHPAKKDYIDGYIKKLEKYLADKPDRTTASIRKDYAALTATMPHAEAIKVVASLYKMDEAKAEMRVKAGGGAGITFKIKEMNPIDVVVKKTADGFVVEALGGFGDAITKFDADGYQEGQHDVDNESDLLLVEDVKFSLHQWGEKEVESMFADWNNLEVGDEVNGTVFIGSYDESPEAKIFGGWVRGKVVPGFAVLFRPTQLNLELAMTVDDTRAVKDGIKATISTAFTEAGVAWYNSVFNANPDESIEAEGRKSKRGGERKPPFKGTAGAEKWTDGKGSRILQSSDKSLDIEYGNHSDRATRHDDGTIVYDFPERIPANIKRKVEQIFKTMKPTTAMTRQEAIEILRPLSADMLKKHYDSNPKVASAVKVLIPSFEYPDWDYRLIGDILKRVTAGKVEAESTGELEEMIRRFNEAGSTFRLGGTYGQYDLWATDKEGKEHRLESGSKKDIKEALIKYRFTEKYQKATAQRATADHEEIPAETQEFNDAETVTKTIIEQLGGQKFFVMTGAKPVTGGKGKELTLKLSPTLQTKDGINSVTIGLNGEDLYDVTFAKYTNRPKAAYTVVDEVKGVYAEDLRRIFTEHTGLETSLGTMRGQKVKAENKAALDELREIQNWFAKNPIKDMPPDTYKKMSDEIKRKADRMRQLMSEIYEETPLRQASTAKHRSKATGEADQDYDHEFYDKIVEDLAKAGFDGAYHEEFDKYQGVYIEVPGIGTYWGVEYFVRGERSDDVTKYKYRRAVLMGADGGEYSANKHDYWNFPKGKPMEGSTLVLTTMDGEDKIIENPTIEDFPNDGEVMRSTFTFKEGTEKDVVVFQSENTENTAEVVGDDTSEFIAMVKEEAANKSGRPTASKKPSGIDVRQSKGKWEVVDRGDNDKVLGTHDTKEKAREQQKAIYASMNAKAAFDPKNYTPEEKAAFLEEAKRLAKEQGFIVDPNNQQATNDWFIKNGDEITRRLNATAAANPIDIGDGYYAHKIGYDRNGNWAVWVSKGTNPAMKIQTKDDAPEAHRARGKYKDLSEAVAALSDRARDELKDYHKRFGTKAAVKKEGGDARPPFPVR